MQYQILQIFQNVQTNIVRIVCQTVRRNTSEILGYPPYFVRFSNNRMVPILLGSEVNKVYCPKIYQNDWRPFPETGPLVLCVPHRPSGYAVSHLFKGEKVNSGTFPCCSENFDPWKLCCCWNLPLYKCLAFVFLLP